VRRRGRYVQYGAHTGTGGDAKSTTPPPANPQVSEVPKQWRKHAREPWRIIFPDLDWKPPEIE
jgi:hypothetical protein